MIVLVSIVIVSKSYSFGIFCALEQKVVRRSAGALSRTLIQIFCSSLFFQQNRQAQVILSQRLNINLDRREKEKALLVVIWDRLCPMRRFTTTFSRLTLENASQVRQKFEIQIPRWRKFNRWFPLLLLSSQQGRGGQIAIPPSLNTISTI